MTISYPNTYLCFSAVIWHYILAALGLDMYSAGKREKPIRYPWWKRLWRIYRFLRRQKRKRKQEQQQKKRKQRNKEHKKNEIWKWHKKVKRRARRMAFKRFFRPKRILLSEYEEQQRLKHLKQKAKKRKRRVFYKSLTKARPADPVKLARQEELKKQQLYKAYKRRRLRRFVLKRYKQIIIDAIKGKGLPKRNQHKKRPSIWLEVFSRDKLVIMINSLTAFLLSYYFVTFISRLSASVAALLFDIRSVIYNNTTSYIVTNNGWTVDAIKTVFGAGPVMALLIALICVLLYSQIYAERGVLKLLILWAILHGFNQIIMGTFMGSLMGQGMGYVIMYSYFMDTDKMIISIAMIALALVIGLMLIRVWVNTANSYYTCSLSQGRKQFIIAQVLLPYIIGNPIILLIALPDFNLFDILINLSLFVFLIPTLLRASLQPDIYFETEEAVRVRWRYRISIFAILFISAVRYALHIGIRLA